MSKFKILLFVIVAGMFIFSGCTTSIPLAKQELGERIFAKTEARIGLEPMLFRAHLGDKIKTTSVHPHDSGFMSGETATEPDDYDNFSLAPIVGLFESIGSEDLGVVAGISARWNLMHYWDGCREGFYSNRQQVSDPRPKDYGSFVFTQLLLGEFTIIPSVGLEGKVGEFTIGAGVGFPYMEWEARSGHDRFARWEGTKKDSWDGFGIRYAGALGFDFSKSTKIFLSVFYEEYKPEFLGEGAKIDGWGGLVALRRTF